MGLSCCFAVWVIVPICTFLYLSGALQVLEKPRMFYCSFLGSFGKDSWRKEAGSGTKKFSESAGEKKNI